MEGPRPLVNRAPRHRKCHPCARVAAPVPASQLIRIPRRVLHPGHCGYDPGGGVPHRRRLSNTISAPDGAPLRGIVEAAHPGRSRRATPEPAPGASFWGTAGMTGWGRGLNAGALPNTVSAPDGFADPGHCGIAPALQPPPQLRGRLEVRPPGALRVGGSPPPEPRQYDRCPRWPDRPGALWVLSCRRSRLPSPAASPTRVLRGRRVWPAWGRRPHRRGPRQYDLCPRWLHQPGALRVSPLRRSHLAGTGACRPSGCGGSCGWRGTRPIPLAPSHRHSGSESSPPIPSLPRFSPRTAPAARPAAETSLSPTSERLSTGNRSMRGTARIPCGAPRVHDLGHPPSGPGAVTVAP